MEHRCVKVDFANLMDAIGIADKRGGRIRLADRRAVQEFLAENHLDWIWVGDLQRQHGLPMATIISSGLMKGLYFYSVDAQEAWLCIATDRQFAELRSYDDQMCFDIALSYSSEDRDTLALHLRYELTALGMSVFVLDVATAPDEPLWGIRFREALFHSCFFVPILTEHYLARKGTSIELFEIAREAVEHRNTEFFYPLIPVVRDPRDLAGRVFEHRGSLAKGFDEQEFEWLRTHIFSVNLLQGLDWLARFFSSLVRNYRNEIDTEFLDCLAPQIEWIELFRFTDGPAAQFLIKHPILTYHHFMMYDSGIVRYFGMGEPTPEALSTSGMPDVVGRILEWLGLERSTEERRVRRPWRVADSAPVLADDNTSEPEPEPTLLGSLFCPNCHFKGTPDWRKIKDYENLLRLGGKSRYGPVMPMCPRCGRSTMVER